MKRCNRARNAATALVAFRLGVMAVAIYAAAKRLVSPSRAEGFDELFRVRVRSHNGDRGFDVLSLAG